MNKKDEKTVTEASKGIDKRKFTLKLIFFIAPAVFWVIGTVLRYFTRAEWPRPGATVIWEASGIRGFVISNLIMLIPLIISAVLYGLIVIKKMNRLNKYFHGGCQFLL